MFGMKVAENPAIMYVSEKYFVQSYSVPFFRQHLCDLNPRKSMKIQMLYGKLAQYYDLIYSSKDYKREVAHLRELILKYKKSHGEELLDVACGTGNHLKYLRDDFLCTGIDIHEEILDVAREHVKGVTFERGDMMTFDLDKTFDIIVCLFSSIGYVKTYSNLKRTLRNFVQHAKPGGVIIIEPWLTRADYRVGSPHMTVYDGEEIKIARLSVSQIEENISVIDMHYLIAEKDKGVQHFVDRHELGLFEIDETLEYMKEAGLRAEYQEQGFMEGRGVFIGVKKKDRI